MGWAVGITEKVNQIAELEFSLWTTIMSPGVGTLSWTAAAADLEELEASEAKLMVDDAFVAELDRAASFVPQLPDDAVLQIIHGQPDPQLRPQYVSVTVSQLAPGNLVKGVDLGIEIAQRVEQLSGAPAMFGMATTGAYGSVAWISGQSSLKELEAASQAVNADPAFLELVDQKASQVFLAPATSQTIYRRIV